MFTFGDRPEPLTTEDRAVLDAIAACIRPGVAFTARELLAHPEVAAVLRAAGLDSRKAIGRRLPRYEQFGFLQRVARDERGVVWVLLTPADVAASGRHRRD